MSDRVSAFESLMPASDLMKQAWVDCLRWAAKYPPILENFRRETGLSIPPAPRSPLDQMIDQATGLDEAIALEFIRWFNRNVWGETDGRASNGETLPGLESIETGEDPNAS